MKEIKNKKKLIIIAAAALLVIAAVVVIILVKKGDKKEAYRNIKVYEIDGKAIVKRDKKGEIEAYENMKLDSKDVVIVSSGKMTLKLDDDKYIYIEEGTELELVAEGSSKNSKTVINLKKGAIVNELQNKLSDASSYEVNTQNSSMMVRGTVYRVEVFKDKKGTTFSKLSVFRGSVEAILKDKEGNLNTTDTRTVDTGKETTAYSDDKTTDFVGNIKKIDYDSFSKATIEIIKELIDKDKIDDVFASKEEPTTENNNNKVYSVEFYYGESIFGTQKIKHGELAKEPMLQPEKEGKWDFDFSKEITEDMKIYWKS